MRMTRGFTLIEILVVIAVIAILAGMLFAGVMTAHEKAKKSATQQTMTGTANILQQMNDKYAYLFKNSDMLYQWDKTSSTLNNGWGWSTGIPGSFAYTYPSAPKWRWPATANSRVNEGFVERLQQFASVLGLKLDSKNFVDAWGGTMLVYSTEQTSRTFFYLVSPGPDGKLATSGTDADKPYKAITTGDNADNITFEVKF